MSTLEISLRVLSPAFVRGRNKSAAELRAPSFKGQLRWWYRAWNPLAFELESDWAEGRVMGGTGRSEGQCPFTLRIRPEAEPALVSWSSIESKAEKGSINKPGGLRYLGFSFGMPSQDSRNKKAIAPGSRFRAVHLVRSEPSHEQVRALLASWWLLAHLGGIGARSRRGFGSLVLESWSWPGQEEVLNDLPLPATAESGDDWSRQILQGLDTLTRWAPGRDGWPSSAPRLDRESRVVLRAEKAWNHWQAAMEDAGRVLAQGRRDRRGRDEIDARVTFGLPLTTGRGTRRRSWQPASFLLEPIKTNRHASPLHLHIGAWRRGVGQCWALLGGPRPGRGDYRVREQRSRASIRRQATDAVRDFVNQLPGRSWEGSR